ncbi:hypothetical protein APY03_0745 [Variovorax sp. WDL1]|nr:hypothetical protein APY03_0745 [Variovorax sp. WDL1]
MELAGNLLNPRALDEGNHDRVWQDGMPFLKVLTDFSDVLGNKVTLETPQLPVLFTTHAFDPGYGTQLAGQRRHAQHLVPPGLLGEQTLQTNLLH